MPGIGWGLSKFTEVTLTTSLCGGYHLGRKVRDLILEADEMFEFSLFYSLRMM